MEEYEVIVPNIEGSYAVPYVARITGEHPVYRYKRIFVPCRAAEEVRGGRRFWFDLVENGVYESAVRRIDKKSGRLLDRQQEWFVLIDGDHYDDLAPTDILFTLFNLRLQGAITAGKGGRAWTSG